MKNLLICGVLSLGLMGCAGGGTGVAPTTQQSLSNAQLSLTVERVLLALGQSQVNKVKDATLKAAGNAAISQATVILNQYQADITAGNTAALAADKANFYSALEQVAVAAGTEALTTAIANQ
jgi:hypothetical protein